MVENRAKPASNIAVKLLPAYPPLFTGSHNILFDKKKRSLYLVGMRSWARNWQRDLIAIERSLSTHIPLVTASHHLHHLSGTSLKEETSED
jgi:hypothetical protein